MSLAHIAILDDEPDITALLGTYLRSHGFRVSELHHGAELMALSHARACLKDITVIQTEVNFLQLYENQPLFSEQELSLRQHGLLTRDPRVKERKKPGLKRARKAPQYTKR